MLALLVSVTILVSSPKEETLTKENLWHTIKEMDVEHPDLVFAQALLESGDFSSQVCKRNNNLFGMKMPETRKTVAHPGFKGYARYESWKQSIYDYKLYQEHLFRNGKLSRFQYMVKLNRTYSAVKDYSLRLKRVIKENKSVISQNF